MHVYQNFLNEQELNSVCSYLINSPDWTKTQDTWNERFINYHSIEDDNVKQLMKSIAERIVDSFDEPVYVETAQLVRWRPGDKLDPPHADCENVDGSPHPYPQRHYSAVIYLNDDFQGGEIFFPNQNIKPKISPGMLVKFSGTAEHLHGVTEVTQGLRYTMVFFFSKDKQFNIL